MTACERGGEVCDARRRHRRRPSSGSRSSASCSALAVLVRPIGVIDRSSSPTTPTTRSPSPGRSLTGTVRRSTGTRSPAGSRRCSASCWCRCTGSPTTPTLALRIDLALLVVVDTLTIVVLAWVAYRFAGRVAAVDRGRALGGVPGGGVDGARRARDVARDPVRGRAGRRVDLGQRHRAHPPCGRHRGRRGACGARPRRRRAAGRAARRAPALARAAPSCWCPARSRARWWSRRGGSGARCSSGRPSPRAATAAHGLAPVQPFARESLAQVAGAVAGGPFDVWRSLREWLNDHPGRRDGRVLGLRGRARRPRRGVGPSTGHAPARGRRAARCSRPGCCSSTRGSAVGLVLHPLPRAGCVRGVADHRGRGRARVAHTRDVADPVVRRRRCGAARSGCSRSCAPRTATSPRPSVAVDRVRLRHRVPRHGGDGVAMMPPRQRVRRVAERCVRLLRRRPRQGGEPRRRRQPGGRRRPGTAPDGRVHARPARRLDRRLHVAHHLVRGEEPAATRARRRR